jgi:hypothetical protein
VYVTNSAAGEPITPWDNANPYYDAQFSQEFSGICGAPPNPSKRALSIWNRNPLSGLPFPGPLYKWVRIGAVSEKSLNLLVAPTYSAPYDPTTPVFYDGTQPPGAQLNISANGSQVLELTALAVLPNGSQKLVQYLVAPSPIALPSSMFLAALTLSGSQNGTDPVFQAPTTNAVYSVRGDGDQDCNGAPLPSKVAVGLYGPYVGVGNVQNALNAIKNGIPSFPPPSTAAKSNYTGQGAWPDVEYLNTGQSPTQLDAIVQTIIQNADVILPSGSTGAALTPLGMSPTNPLTVVVNGNLDISNWNNDGYGLLLVTGTFTYDPDTDWNGMVLVIGRGVVNNVQNGQFKQINGAMFVAQTRDAGGNLLANLGGASVTYNANMQGNGVRYNSCWIQKAQPTGSYRILSFHEISQ